LFNELRPHQGKWCFGKTPMQTFIDALPLAREKSGRISGDRGKRRRLNQQRPAHAVRQIKRQLVHISESLAPPNVTKNAKIFMNGQLVFAS
jgi:hypothetical protein